ncbi:hypothetical protein E0L31_025360 [Serratia marcescens]|nr:hypothetical protein [Serratia marcescens]
MGLPVKRGEARQEITIRIQVQDVGAVALHQRDDQTATGSGEPNRFQAQRRVIPGVEPE